MLFAITCSLYGLLSDYILNNYLYYILAAYTDLLIIYLLSRIIKPTNAIMLLQKICLYFIYINLAGLAVYYYELPPVIYSFSCGVLYATALLVSVFEDRNYGTFRNIKRAGGFYCLHNKGARLLRVNKTAIRD